MREEHEEMWRQANAQTDGALTVHQRSGNAASSSSGHQPALQDVQCLQPASFANGFGLEQGGNAVQIPGSNLQGPNPGLQVPNLQLAGLTGNSLAGQWHFAGNSAQAMIDQVVGECIVHEESGEFHEPDVEDDIPPAGLLPPNSAHFNISTPVGSGPVPMEHDLMLPPSTLQQP